MLFSEKCTFSNSYREQTVVFVGLKCMVRFILTYLVWMWNEMQDQNKRHHPLDLNTLKGHGDSVTGLCFSPDARSLATGKKKSSFFVQLNVYLCLLMFMIHSILLELELWMYYVGGKFVLVLYGHSFAWNMSPLCQMWVIWKERNGWNFNSVEDFSYGVGNFVFLECCLSAGGNF